MLAEGQPVPDRLRRRGDFSMRVLPKIPNQRELNGREIRIPGQPEQTRGQVLIGRCETSKDERRSEAGEFSVPRMIKELIDDVDGARRAARHDLPVARPAPRPGTRVLDARLMPSFTAGGRWRCTNVGQTLFVHLEVT